MKHPVRYFIHPLSLLVIWRNQGITNKKPKESDERTVSHAGEKREKKLCRPGKKNKFRLESENEETEFAVGGDSGRFIFFLFFAERNNKNGESRESAGRELSAFSPFLLTELLQQDSILLCLLQELVLVIFK